MAPSGPPVLQSGNKKSVAVTEGTKVADQAATSLRDSGVDRTRLMELHQACLDAMLIAYWRLNESLPKARVVMAPDSGIEPERFAAALSRLSDGDPAAEVLDDAFVTVYSVTGTLEDCMAHCHELHRTGATEIAVSFVGDDPESAIDLSGDARAGA